MNKRFVFWLLLSVLLLLIIFFVDLGRKNNTSKNQIDTTSQKTTNSRRIDNAYKSKPTINGALELPDITSFKNQMDTFAQPNEAINYIKDNTSPSYLSQSYYQAILHFSNNNPDKIKILYDTLPNGQTKSVVVRSIVNKLFELENVADIDKWINRLENKSEQEQASSTLREIIEINQLKQ